jgi:hypothetical protein
MDNLTKILKEVWKRAIIGYPPSDHLDEKRTIKEAKNRIKKWLKN